MKCVSGVTGRPRLDVLGEEDEDEARTLEMVSIEPWGIDFREPGK